MNTTDTLLLVLALIAAAGGTISTMTLRMKALERRADGLERRLGLLLDHFGIEEPEPAGMAEVRALAQGGRTVEAMRAHRRVTGSDLAEAKRAVEALSE